MKFIMGEISVIFRFVKVVLSRLTTIFMLGFDSKLMFHSIFEKFVSIGTVVNLLLLLSFVLTLTITIIVTIVLWLVSSCSRNGVF